MPYRENVDLAAVALVRGEDANWELARLTFENTWNHGEPRNPERVPMAQWCRDVRAASGRKFATQTGYVYKMVWRRTSLYESKESLSWTEAFSLATGGSEREDSEGASAPEPTEREKERAYTTLAEQVYAAPPEHREYLFRRLAQDPEITERAAEVGSPVSRAVSGLEQRAELTRRQRREQMIERDPIARGFDAGKAQVDLMSVCDRYARESERVAREIAELLRRSGDISDDRRFWIQQAVERLESVLALLKGYAEHGQTDLDAFLDSVLAGGDRG